MRIVLPNRERIFAWNSGRRELLLLLIKLKSSPFHRQLWIMFIFPLLLFLSAANLQRRLQVFSKKRAKSLLYEVKQLFPGNAESRIMVYCLCGFVLFIQFLGFGDKSSSPSSIRQTRHLCASGLLHQVLYIVKFVNFRESRVCQMVENLIPTTSVIISRISSFYN